MMASVLVLAMTPGPTTARILESGLDRYFTPTPGTAPVRTAERMLALMIAFGAPVTVSLRTKTWMERGRPSFLFSALEPYHFTPVLLKRPPR